MRRCVAGTPGRPELLATKGAVLVALGRSAAAVPLLEAALDAGPDDRRWSTWAWPASSSVRGPALAALETAMRVNPDNARGPPT